MSYTADTKLKDITGDPLIAPIRDSLFPMEDDLIDPSWTVRDIWRMLPYHSNIQVDESLAVLNALHDMAERNEKFYYPVYETLGYSLNDERKRVGLFHFSSGKRAPFAIICAGGSFSYVGSIHEAFPYALYLSQKGYHAFVLHYRADRDENKPTRDLAHAISCIFALRNRLRLNFDSYSIWGANAGARLALNISRYGARPYGGNEQKPCCVILQYHKDSDWDRREVPTFTVFGSDDRITPPFLMKKRAYALPLNGVESVFRVYPHVGHGFGLGKDTSAEGWIDQAIRFWEDHMDIDAHDRVVD